MWEQRAVLVRSTILAILASGLLAASARAQEQLPPLQGVPAPALQLPAAEAPHPKEPGHEEEAKPWNPQVPGPIEKEAEQPPAYPWLFFRAEYLLWWYKEMPLPPLLTRGLATDTNPGALGQPGTVVMFGQGNLYEKPQSGLRSSVVCWCDPEGCLGAEVGGLLLLSRSVVVQRPSSGGPSFPVQGEPFFNAATGSEDVSLFLFPGVVSGVDHIAVTTRLWGAEANGLANLWCWRGLRVEGLAGFRALQFFESINLAQFTTVQNGVPLVGGEVAAGYDSFGVTNNFYGGQVGLRGELRNGRLFVDLQGKVALGSTQEVVNIAGQTTLLQPGQPTRTLPGDLYALSSNIGGHSRTALAMLPEGNVNMGWQMLEHLRIRLGYSFLYLSRAARAGDQIDRTLNPNLIPGSITYGLPGGPPRPGVTITQSTFFVEGFNFGLEFMF